MTSFSSFSGLLISIHEGTAGKARGLLRRRIKDPPSSTIGHTGVPFISGLQYGFKCDLSAFIYPVGRAKLHLLRRGRKARLRVNLEQPPRIHAGGVERFTCSARRHPDSRIASRCCLNRYGPNLDRLYSVIGWPKE
jgi:hypothetical protein